MRLCPQRESYARFFDDWLDEADLPPMIERASPSHYATVPAQGSRLQGFVSGADEERILPCRSGINANFRGGSL